MARTSMWSIKKYRIESKCDQKTIPHGSTAISFESATIHVTCFRQKMHWEFVQGKSNPF